MIKTLRFKLGILLGFLASLGCQRLHNRFDELQVHCQLPQTTLIDSFVIKLISIGDPAIKPEWEAIGINPDFTAVPLAVSDQNCLIVPKDKEDKHNFIEILVRDRLTTNFVEFSSNDIETEFKHDALNEKLIIPDQRPYIQNRYQCSASVIWVNDKFEPKVFQRSLDRFVRSSVSITFKDERGNTVFEHQDLDQETTRVVSFSNLQLEDGTYQVDITATDLYALAQEQNQSTTDSCKLILDRKAPKVTSSLNQQAFYGNSKKIRKIEPGSTINFSINELNVKTFYCLVATDETGASDKSCKVETQVVNDAISSPANGIWRLFYFAKDAAGNETPMTEDVFAVYDEQTVQRIHDQVKIAQLSSLNQNEVHAIQSYENALQSYLSLELLEEQKAVTPSLVQGAWDIDRFLRIQFSYETSNKFPYLAVNHSQNLLAILNHERKLAIYSRDFKLLKSYENVSQMGFIGDSQWWVLFDNLTDLLISQSTGEAEYDLSSIGPIKDLVWSEHGHYTVVTKEADQRRGVYLLSFAEDTFSWQKFTIDPIKAFPTRFQIHEESQTFLYQDLQGIHVNRIGLAEKNIVIPTPKGMHVFDFAYLHKKKNPTILMTLARSRDQISSSPLEIPEGLYSWDLAHGNPKLEQFENMNALLKIPGLSGSASGDSYLGQFLTRMTKDSSYLIYKDQSSPWFYILDGSADSMKSYPIQASTSARPGQIQLIPDKNEVVTAIDKISFRKINAYDSYYVDPLKLSLGDQGKVFDRGKYFILSNQNGLSVRAIEDRLMPEITRFSRYVTDDPHFAPDLLFLKLETQKLRHPSKGWLVTFNRDYHMIEIFNDQMEKINAIIIPATELVTALSWSGNASSLLVGTTDRSQVSRLYEIKDFTQPTLESKIESHKLITQIIDLNPFDSGILISEYQDGIYSLKLVQHDGSSQTLVTGEQELVVEQKPDSASFLVTSQLVSDSIWPEYRYRYYDNPKSLSFSGEISSQDNIPLRPRMNHLNQSLAICLPEECQLLGLKDGKKLSIFRPGDLDRSWTISKYEAIPSLSLGMTLWTNGQLDVFQGHSNSDTPMKNLKRFSNIFDFGLISNKYWYSISRDQKILFHDLATGDIIYEYAIDRQVEDVQRIDYDEQRQRLLIYLQVDQGAMRIKQLELDAERIKTRLKDWRIEWPDFIGFHDSSRQD